MRIDGAIPDSPAASATPAREAKANPAPETAAPEAKDFLEVQHQPGTNTTNVLVQMRPGNIVVYKFIDEASGRLIEQIPSEQLLELAQSNEARDEKKRT